MKNLKSFLAIATILLVIILVAFSCSKKRIEDDRPLNEYDSQSTNDYTNSKKQEEQEYDIDSSGSCPLTGLQGTEICLSKSCLMKPNGDSVWFPYKIKLVELYKIKDIIFYQMSTLSNDTALETDGTIRLRAFKDGTELSFRPGACAADVKMPNAAPKNYMQVYYGTNANSNVNWTNFVSGVGGSPTFSTVSSPSRYAGLIGKLGWINCGIKRSSNTNHTLTFASSTDNLSNVALFVYLPATRTLMQVFNTTSKPIPAGANAVVIAYGVNSSGQLYSFNQSLTVNTASQIEVTMSATNDASFTAFLDGL
jgi:hypothetical protein